MFAALAIARHLQAVAGTSIKRIVQTLRHVRSATIELNGPRLTLDPDKPPQAQELLAGLRRAGR